jgi:hypothetical protein
MTRWKREEGRWKREEGRKKWGVQSKSIQKYLKIFLAVIKNT